MKQLTLLFLCLCTATTTFSEAPKKLPESVTTGDNFKLNLPTTDSSVVRFVNVESGQALTVNGTAATPGLNVTASFWKNLDSQKWRVLERGDVYLLLPLSQHKEWANFLKRTRERGGDSLPSVTIVVSIDVTRGAIVQQVLHGRSNQQWVFTKVKVGEDRILIESPGRGKCIGPKVKPEDTPSFYDRTKQKLKGIFSSSKPQPSENTDTPVELAAADCNEQDLKQQWRVEPVPQK